MPELKLPLDLESRSDYRMFSNALSARPEVAALPGMAPLFIFCRLWIALGYQADTTHRPGLLNENGETLFRSDLAGMEIEPGQAVEALLTGRLLAKTDEGLFCDLFARLNEHLSPKHKRACDVGNEHSRIKRNERNIVAGAVMQQRLLPPEIYKRRDGSELNAADMTRITVLVMTLDHCLKVNGRLKGSYTEGLVADAAAADAVMQGWSQKEKDEFYYWVNDHREEPWMHRSAELILSHFDGLREMFQEGKA
jgi:hypothetical protein